VYYGPPAALPGYPPQAVPAAAYGGVPGAPVTAYTQAPVATQAAPTGIEPVPQSIQTVPQSVHAAPGGMSAWAGSYGGPAASDACDACGSADCGGACGSGLFAGGLRQWFHSGPGAGWFDHSCLQGGLAYPRPVRVWGGVEGLWWWNKERNLPVLATTSVAGTPFAQAGVLGQPGTRVLFGGGEFDGNGSEGVRGTLGYWFDRNQNFGIFTRAFRYGEEEIGYHAASDGNPILARPFFDVGLGIEDAVVVAYPGIARGRIDIDTSNEVRGYDVLLRKMLYYGDCNRLDLIGGYHATEVFDDVRVAHEIISVDPEGRVPVGTRINTADTFRAENEFHGGSIGVMATGYDGRLTWNLLSKVSFGNNRETVSIRGSSTTSIPGGGSATFDQGLLALDSNSGVYERDVFAIVPELDLSLMYNLSSMLSVSVGYSLIYWSDIALAGDAIDTTINPTQIEGPIIGPSRPRYSLVDDDFWLHGLTFGVHGRF
jgi:hypothetical protein